MELRLIEK